MICRKVHDTVIKANQQMTCDQHACMYPYTHSFLFCLEKKRKKMHKSIKNDCVKIVSGRIKGILLNTDGFSKVFARFCNWEEGRGSDQYSK